MGFDIDHEWSKVQIKQRFEEVQLVDPSQPKAPDTCRFVCVSDTHARHDRMIMPEGDVLLHAGDFSSIGLMNDITRFSEWLRDLPYQHKVVIAGNHDIPFDADGYLHGDLFRSFHRHHLKEPYDPAEIKRGLAQHCTYLEDEMATVMGYSIYGSPWQPVFYDWAFNLPRDAHIEAKWKQIPTDTDILITHGPPLGRGDRCAGGNRAGCHYLLKEIQERIKPKYHVFGHIHEGYGVSSDGVTTYINASSCTLRYHPSQPPLVFDLLMR